MGCGAGKHDGEGGEGKKGFIGRQWQKLSAEEQHKDPFQTWDYDNIVLCSATRPDWAKADYFVFEHDHDDEEVDADGWRKQRSTVGPQKGGRFFSKFQGVIGTWRIAGNVLSLVWPGTNRTDTVIAQTSPKHWVNAQTNLQVTVMEPKELPEWFTPGVIAEKFQCETVSSKAFECPVCYFELCKFQAGVIRQYSRRCCGHYFHKDCAQHLLKAKAGSGEMATCPLCGVAFSEVKEMPDLAHDPRDWFAVCDVDFGGELDSHEVIEALGCVLPVSRHKLEKNVKAHWHEWDPDGDGTITLQEFILPQRGLKDWALSHLQVLRNVKEEKGRAVPSIDRNPREWFHYWDRDSSGTLEKDEVVRALIRTFCRDDNGNPHLPSAHDMREVIESLWLTLGYRPFDAVTFEEYVRPYGLLDQFLHNQSSCKFFGMDVELTA